MARLPSERERLSVWDFPSTRSVVSRLREFLGAKLSVRAQSKSKRQQVPACLPPPTQPSHTYHFERRTWREKVGWPWIKHYNTYVEYSVREGGVLLVKERRQFVILEAFLHGDCVHIVQTCISLFSFMHVIKHKIRGKRFKRVCMCKWVAALV